MDDLDELLADLQSSVSCSKHHFHPRTISDEQQRNCNGTPGYGSLRTKPTSPKNFTTEEINIPQTQHFYSSGHENHSNNSATTSHHQYQEPLSRSQNITYPVGKSLPFTRAVKKNSSNNLSELDSLLLDLSNAKYKTNFDKREDIFVNQSAQHTYANPISKLNDFHSYPSSSDNGRPAVDVLLNEMDNTSIYAIPNEISLNHRSNVPSRQIMITVRETKTKKIGGSQESEQYTKKQDTFDSTSMYASSATKELDDLMASLSDFKISSSSHHHQTVTDYAKPNKGISHNTDTTCETSNIAEEEQADQLDSMLGNLQANMSRQGVNTVQKGCCNACEKPIVGQVITALGKTWHPEHFTCNHCSQELGTRNFFERDGYAYCEPDYHNLFSPRCAYCNGAILDKCVTALDKTWHTEHFFCAQCGQQFGEDGFHERDGKPYCRNDYFEMFAPKCNGCNRAIMENYISALNSQWHPECFVCRDCRQPFQGGSFFDHDGLPYCEMHYHAKRGSLCAGCSKPITGRCITAMFKKFHPEHFVCAFCLKQLNKGTFKEQNDKPYCHTCFDKIFG